MANDKIREIQAVRKVTRVRRVATGGQGLQRIAPQSNSRPAGGSREQYAPALRPSVPPLGGDVLTLPLTLTRLANCQRTWEEVEELVERLNDIFSQASIQFEVLDQADCAEDVQPREKTASGAWPCPFKEEIDHNVPCLHLFLVHETVTRANNLPFNCGRCLALPDKTSNDDFRAAATGLAVHLGLSMVRAEFRDRLTASGQNGTLLTPQECQTLRHHACQMLGQSVAREMLPVKVWTYQIESPAPSQTMRDLKTIVGMLEETNTVWHQAGIQLFQHAHCHIHEHEVSATDWEALLAEGPAKDTRLAPLVAHDPGALHLFFVNGAQSRIGPWADRKHKILVIRDQICQGTVRPLCSNVGWVLGLPLVTAEEQLMAWGKTGTLLTPSEIERARAGALNLANARQ